MYIHMEIRNVNSLQMNYRWIKIFGNLFTFRKYFTNKYLYLQTCVCANRFLIQENIYENFINKFAAAMDSQLQVGDGMTAGVTIGPLINKRAVDKVVIENMTNLYKYGIYILPKWAFFF